MPDVVSLVDLLPTLVEVAAAEPVPGGDGRSIWPLAAGLDRIAPGRAVIEYLAEGVRAPQLTLVQDHLKLVVCPGDPDQLYDLASDPDELVNLAGDAAWLTTLDRLRDELLTGRDLEQLREDVLASQGRRRLIHEALATGPAVGWDHRPQDDSDQRYVRGDFWSALARGRLGVDEVLPTEPLRTLPDRLGANVVERVG